jgi:hypothetical protein
MESPSRMICGMLSILAFYRWPDHRSTATIFGT